jgi:hypothetical protein
VDSSSVLVDGIRPLVGKEEPITEMISCTVSAESMAAMAGRLVGLNRLIADCHAFWESTAQIEPVYIKWWAGGAPRAQYALIYRMNLQAVEASREMISQFDVTIEVVREPYWRALPPGANPILWHLRDRGGDYSLSDLSLVAGTDHFVYETIQNKHEYDSTDLPETRTQNYVTIPKEVIPGDAPALAYINLELVETATHKVHEFYVGRTTKTKRFTDGSSDFQPLTIFNMSDFFSKSASTGTVNDADCGVSSRSSTTRQYIQYLNLVPGTENDVITLLARPLSLRGTWAAFLRCRQTNGSAGDVKVRLRLGDSEITLDYVDMPVLAGTVSTCVYLFGIASMGTFTIPLHSGISASPDGTGLDRSGGIIIAVDLDNTAGANRNVIFLDLVLMPLDEPFAIVRRNTDQDTGASFYFDNSQYASHGIDTELAALATDTNVVYELRGNLPTLVPGVDNRLNFFHTSTDNTDIWSEPDSAKNDMNIRLNIVPRWRGVIDV